MINKTIKRHNNKNIKKQKYKLKKKTLKINDINKNNQVQNKQKGGNIKKEKFEVHSLTDFDYERYKISNYINANIDWGNCPGPPPQPDCCIL